MIKTKPGGYTYLFKLCTNKKAIRIIKMKERSEEREAGECHIVEVAGNIFLFPCVHHWPVKDKISETG